MIQGLEFQGASCPGTASGAAPWQASWHTGRPACVLSSAPAAVGAASTLAENHAVNTDHQKYRKNATPPKGLRCG